MTGTVFTLEELIEKFKEWKKKGVMQVRIGPDEGGQNIRISPDKVGIQPIMRSVM